MFPNTPRLQRIADAVKCIVAAACLAAGVGASASPVPVRELTSGSGWEARVEGSSDWVAAIVAPNPISRVVRVDPFGRWGASDPIGQLIWHPDVGGVAPDEVWFRRSFYVDYCSPSCPDIYSAWFAADDWAEISLNGISLDTYLLDENKDSAGQPVPHLVGLNGALRWKDGPGGDGIGLNTVTIRVRDGDATAAFDRGYSWLFVDGFNVETWAGVGVRFVDEPQSGLLAVLALAAFALQQRKPRTR